MSQVIRLSALSMPSPGALLGTRGSQSVMEHINAGLQGSAFIGSIYDKFASTRNHFIENIVKPIRDASAAISNTITSMMNPDVIRPLTKVEDLSYIPPSMYLPIVMYEPVKALLQEGRISGFGFEYEHLPKEDVYGRLINNGTINDVLRAPKDEDGIIYSESLYVSTDPNLSDDELTSIEDTRSFLFRLLGETNVDPTDPDNERG